MEARLHVDLIYRSTGSDTDAIRDNSRLMCDALGARSLTTAASYDLGLLGDTRNISRVIASARGPAPPGARHVILLQYNPYSFQRRGIAWWLPTALRSVRRARPDAQIVVLVHELWVTMDSLRHAVLGAPQRIVFARLGRMADFIAVSTESLVAPAAQVSRRPIGVLPSGSNLPDARAERAQMRRTLEITHDQPVVAAFGMRHPSRSIAHLKCAVEAIAAQYPDVVVLNLGATAPRLRIPGSSARVLNPGALKAEDLAGYLCIADLLLLPFTDGVATRRTTVMAGLQHGVPILSTDGRSTSVELRVSEAISLVDTQAAPTFYANAACDLLADEAERLRLGRAGRALYEKRFSWPVIAGDFVRLLDLDQDPPHAG